MSDLTPTQKATIKAALEAGARAYAADTYRGTKDLSGAASTWDTLADSDRAACIHKAQVVLEAALPVLDDLEAGR